MKGFKSFAHPTRIPISPRISVIVGPNGSGKSNIVDALRWVFGEQSMKELRAEERSDVIFSGSEKTRPSQNAFVELTFSLNGEIVRIAREITRNGKSGYFLNGDQVRLKDIKNFINSTEKGMYSIISQGQIDKIVTSSAEDLRKLIEEAAGTAVYRDRKKEALTRLAATEANLERIKDILFEVEKNKKSLYLKAKKAERYKEYSEKLSQVKARYFSGVYTHEKRLLDSLSEQREELKGNLKATLKELAGIESKWSVLREEFNEIDKEMESFTGLLEDHKKRQMQLLELRETFTQKLNRYESNYVEIVTKIDSFKEETRRLKTREEEVLMIEKSLNKEIEEKEKVLLELEEKREALMSNYSQREMELLKKKQEYDGYEKQLHKIQTEKQHLADLQVDLEKRLKMITEQFISKKTRLEDLEDEIEELSKSVSKFDESAKKLLDELNEIKNNMEKLTSERENIKEELEELFHRKREISSEVQILQKQIDDYQGFSHAVKKVFENKEKFEGIVDVVANIIEVEPQYTEAIEALLGGVLQHIVVDTAEHAKKIIEFAKRTKIGRLTLIPLDLIEEPGQNQHFDFTKDTQGVIGMARELIKINRDKKGLEKLPGYLFGGDIVVKDIDTAIFVKKERKIWGRIATLDGEIVSVKGSMTGGKSSSNYSLLSRKQKIQKLEEELNRLLNKEEKLQETFENIKKEIEELRNYSEVVSKELINLNSQSASSKRMLQELVKTRDEILKEVESLEKLKVEYTQKFEGINARYDIIEKSIKEYMGKINSLKSMLDDYSKEILEEKEKLDELNSRITDVKMDLTNLMERRIQYDSEIKRIHLRYKEIETELGELLREKGNVESEMENLKQILQENEKEIEALKRETEELFESMKYRKSGKEQKFQEVKKLEEKMEELRNKVEKVREKLHKIDLKIQEKEIKISGIPEEFRNEIIVKENELDELKTQIEELENKIKYLGSVDLEAEEEYKRVEKEYNDLYLQKEDLESARKKLIDLIEKTDEEARKVFMGTFNVVNGAFKRYVEQLFYGGTGIMRLTDEANVLDSGVEIVITKAGRRAQKLQLLSGGEKALVGLALLMALLEAQPSAFYVLDEVDAPLDEYNAEKFRRLLENSRAQFIIVTHNKIVMEAADVLHGVTMVDGVSTIVPVRMEEVV
nr:chromosome segregation protein SMC [Thermosipho ferrireducens]